MDDRFGFAVLVMDVTGEDVVEDEHPVVDRTDAFRLGLEILGQFIGSGWRKQSCQCARGLVEQCDGPGRGHALLHLRLGGLERVVPVAFAVAEQFGSRNAVRPDVVEGSAQVVRDGGFPVAWLVVDVVPERRDVVEQGRIAGGVEVFAHDHQRPYGDVAVGIMLVDGRVLVEHEPLRQ